MWERIKPKKIYLSIFLYSCIAVSLLTIVFTLLLSHRFAQSAIEEMDTSSQEKINQLVQASEFTLQKLRQFALKIYSDENISVLMRVEKVDYSPIIMQKAAISLREFMSSEPFIHGVYLINFDLDQIYTSESSIYTTRDFYDQEILQYIKSQKTPYLQYFNHIVEDESYLALVVPAARPNQNFHGYAVILFSKPLLNLNMLQISEEDQNKIYIEDKQKKFILGNTDPALTQAMMAKESHEAQESWKWETDNETWFVRSEQLPIEGWNVYHLSPISLWEAKAAEIRVEIISYSLLMLLALLIYLYWQSYRSLKPITDVVHQLQAKLGNKHSISQHVDQPHEIAWIRSGFHSLVEQIEQLDLSIKSSKALIKDDFLRQWILSSKTSKPIEKFIETETEVLRTGRFQMAVIRLESYGRFKEGYDFASRKLMRYAMGNIMSEVLSNYGFAAVTVDFGSDHVVALFSTPHSEQVSSSIEAMEEVRVQISRWVKLEVHAAISSVLDIEENMQAIYEQLNDMTLMGFIHHENRVFTSDDMERYERVKESDLDEALLKQVIHCVQLKNDKGVEECLNQLTLHMQDLSYEECRLQLNHMIYSIMKSFKQENPFQGMKSIHSFLEQFSTLVEVKSWLQGELLRIIEQHNKKNSVSRKEDAATEMVEYVRNHFHNPMLAVDDIAAHVSMSVNYARQIFKQRFHSSLSDYIANQRIEHAIKLLTTTDWTVADITEQSGFQTKSTFFAAFKKITGLTPNQYRLAKTNVDE